METTRERGCGRPNFFEGKSHSSCQRSASWVLSLLGLKQMILFDENVGDILKE